MAQQIGYSFKKKDDLSVMLNSSAFSDASPEDLRVLVTLILSDCNITRAELCECSFCDEETLTGALQYWRGAGVLVKGRKAQETQKASLGKDTQGESNADKDERSENHPTDKKPSPVASLDKFTETPSDELARAIEKERLQTLIEACQQLVGKTLSTGEINIIVGMYRELSLDGDYIITLISYCYENERRSLKYVEKMAFVLTGQGITEEADLVQYIDERKRFATLEWQLKKKFGMGNRDFTQKQAQYVHKWESEYGYPLDVITLAFDITVDTIGKTEFKYMDTILTKWYTSGCRTEGDVLSFMEQEKRERQSATPTKAKPDAKPKNSTVGDSSFDTDDFFNRALARSYKD